jgi:hypothetical protein
MEITTHEFKKFEQEIQVAFLNANKQKREAIIKPILTNILQYKNANNIVYKFFVNRELDKPELLKIWKAVKNEHTSN